MLENYFAKPSTIDRIHAHWLAPQIERYVEWMQTNGYADRNIVSRVPYLCQFADFTERRGTTDLNSAAAPGGGVRIALGVHLPSARWIKAAPS